MADAVDLRRKFEDVQFRLRRLARAADRAGWVIVAVSARRASEDVGRAFVEDAEFRSHRGIAL